jgi:predicted N-acetyltransferase YhbS
VNHLRQATAKDIARIAEIERQCFPEAEAASLQSFNERFAVFPECFFVLEVNNEIVGHINGCIYDSPELPDELYSDASLHSPDGKYQTVFGLAVVPEYQKKGYASLLIQHLIKVSETKGHHGIVLTCKDYLVDFYQRYGFKHLGKSDSNHGGVSWNDMLLEF